MGTDTRGFASMSKKRHKETSSTGGKNANKRGLKHQWSTEKARAAALKAVQNKKNRMTQAAQVRLLNLGFKQEDLAKLQLTPDEYIYFGGVKATSYRSDKLLERVKALYDGENSEHQLP